MPADYAMAASYDNATQKVTFNLTVKNGTWMGFGFGNGMDAGTDMVMCAVTSAGVGACKDMTSVGYKKPAEDSTQSIVATFAANAAGTDTTAVKIVRALDTNDSKDFAINLDTEIPISWAIQTTSTSFSRMHDKKGGNVTL